MKRRCMRAVLVLLGILCALPGAAAPDMLTAGVGEIGGAFLPILQMTDGDAAACALIFSAMGALDSEHALVFDENTLADGYDLSPDGRTYTFHLKDGLKFSDGSALTAEDVAFTFSLTSRDDYDGPLAGAFGRIEGYDAYLKQSADALGGVAVLDERTVAFTLTEPSWRLARDIACLPILSKAYYDKADFDEVVKQKNVPLGSGPFMRSSDTTGQRVMLVPNPNWYGRQPRVGGVTLVPVKESRALSSLLGGEVDLVRLPTADLATLDALEENGLQSIAILGDGLNAIMVNHASFVLADVNVRKALMCAMDREAFIDSAFQGLAATCLAPIYPSLWAYPADDSALDDYAHDPKRAGALLDAAGWVDADGDGVREKDQRPLELTLYIYNDAGWTGVLADQLAEQWGQVGVALTVRRAKFDRVIEDVYDKRAFGDFDLWMQGIALTADPDMRVLFGTAAYEDERGLNPGGYQDPIAEELMRAIDASADPAERAALYGVWAGIANDTLPALFLSIRFELWGAAQGVEGLEAMNAFYPWTACLIRPA